MSKRWLAMQGAPDVLYSIIACLSDNFDYYCKMKRFFFIAMLGIALTMQGRADSEAAAYREAVKSAYAILKVYYPSNILCADDTIYTGGWWSPFSKEFEGELKHALRYEKDIEDLKKYVKKEYSDDPVYSEILHSLFGSEPREGCKYIAEFTAPYKGLILCSILPIDKRVGVDGAPQGYDFLFQYNDKGEIDRVIRGLIHYD